MSEEEKAFQHVDLGRLQDLMRATKKVLMAKNERDALAEQNERLRKGLLAALARQACLSWPSYAAKAPPRYRATQGAHSYDAAPASPPATPCAVAASNWASMRAAAASAPSMWPPRGAVSVPPSNSLPCQ